MPFEQLERGVTSAVANKGDVVVLEEKAVANRAACRNDESFKAGVGVPESAMENMANGRSVFSPIRLGVVSGLKVADEIPVEWHSVVASRRWPWVSALSKLCSAGDGEVGCGF